MTRTSQRLPLAFIAALVLGMVAVSTTSAASTGRICGQVTAFTAPVVGTNGDITVNGVVEAIDDSLAASLAAGTTLNVLLSALATADATTCLDITADTGGVIVGISIAAAAQVCGEVELSTVTGLTTINGVVVPTSLLTANAALAAYLDIAIDANADVCVDLTVDTTTGLVAGVAVNADFDVCGAVEVDGAGNATVGGVTIPASMIDADAAAALRLAALVDALVCVTVDGTTTGTTTSVDVGVTATICATVTAVGTGTISLEGITLNVAGNAAANIRVGDEVCVAMAPAPGGGNPVTGVSPFSVGAPPTTAGGAPVLPNTAMAPEQTAADALLAWGIVLAVLSVCVRARHAWAR